MKTAITFIVFLTLTAFAQGQILKKITDRTKNKVNNTVDDTKNPDKNKDQADSTKKEEAAAANNSKTEAGPATLKAYSKYDFVPGEKIIVFEDFMQDAIGDLPAKWNTNSAGETVTVEGKQGHWFQLTKPGWFMPDFIDSLPQDFTLEYDVFADAPVHSWGITTSLAELKNKEKPTDEQQHINSFTLNILPGVDANGSTQYERVKNGVGEQATTAQTNHFKDITKPYHIAIWRQKERLRIYFDEDKAWDVPKAFLPETKLNSVYFLMQLSDNWHFFIGNIRLAVGAPDTRNKILTQNKWVTHGILFDVNSATIKPESYGTLKEMANVMKEYPDLKVKIVGHTDADGSDAANLDLSKRRAASVKAMLAKEFGIDESWMETDGKGETEPIDKNDTPAGKANNRRVEFIKI
ncbi:MAG: OmpA family protein [Chitinophagaceae bacterium]|nr:MAG: OmpA family protein [Chitinophagaceae bacterium]